MKTNIWIDPKDPSNAIETIADSCRKCKCENSLIVMDVRRYTNTFNFKYQCIRCNNKFSKSFKRNV